MDALELLDLIQKGESSKVQFKERIHDAYKIGTEMVAFANTKGGKIIVGIHDKTGDIKGLNYNEIQQTNELLSNAASDNVKSPLYIFTEIITVGKDKVVVADIPEGTSKPHTDNKGIIWVKNASDKRRVTSREEIARLLQSSGNLYADEILINNSSINDLDKEAFLQYFVQNWGDTPENLGIGLDEALQNTSVMKNNQLTVGGLLFFGKNIQKFRAAFHVKAVSFFGNNIENTEYRDSEDIKGTIPEIFKKTMSFLLRNLRKTQQNQNFNTQGKLEVSKIALEELLQNALIHRDYFINAPIRLFIFDNRIEIISPGSLPNSLTVNNIKFGNSVIRNNLLTSFCSQIMNYRGIGSGVKRALKAHPETDFINDKERELFISILKRPQI